MTRTLTAGMKTAAAAAEGEIFHLFDLGFSGGTLYLTDASNNVTWSGNTYTSIKIRHDPVQETPVLGAQLVRLIFDGVDTSITARIRQQNYTGQNAAIRFAHMASDGTITADPVIIYQGLMNAAFEVRESFGRQGGTASVSTRIVSPFAIINKRNGIRANVESHAAVFSGDKFWRHVANITGQGVRWGNAMPVVVVGQGGSGGAGGGDSTEKF